MIFRISKFYLSFEQQGSVALSNDWTQESWIEFILPCRTLGRPSAGEGPRSATATGIKTLTSSMLV